MIFNYKSNRIFVFSDTHRLHKYIDIPQDTDIVICLGDAIEDNLSPDNYTSFLEWYASQPGKKYFLPGNHELIFEIAPKWGELLFKSGAITLCIDSHEVINGISFYFHSSINPVHLTQEVDFLLTHYNPEMISGYDGPKPKCHLFGHDHDTKGVVFERDGTIYCNVCKYNESRRIIKEKIAATIKRVRTKRHKKMKTFNEFRDKVYEIAQIRFGELTDEIKHRLDVELTAIARCGKTNLLVCIWRLFDEMSKNGIFAKLSINNEYGVSLVCYLLGITLFNPLDHSDLPTEQLVLKAFRRDARINFRIDVNSPEFIEQRLKEWGYRVEIESACNIYYMKVGFEEDELEIDFQYYSGVCKLQRAFREMGDKFSSIPYDDKGIFETIYNLDLYGTTTACFSPITLDALRFIKPTTLNELATALSFTKETQYEDLMNYISARQIDRTNKFAQYVEAHNLYKLAYIKKHYPEYFNKVLTYK